MDDDDDEADDEEAPVAGFDSVLVAVEVSVFVLPDSDEAAGTVADDPERLSVR